MKTKIFTALLLGLLAQAGLAQTFDKAKLDQYFDELEANNKFMGSVAISQNGNLVYTRSVGFADVEHQLRANENSKYRIGSISKTFTSVLILKAVEASKLDMNQTIATYFPTIKNADKITVRLLLTHRSGIHSFTNDKDYLSWCTQPKTEPEMIDIIAKGGSDFEPDSKAEYSNSNFVLLSYILEKTFGQSYSELVAKYIAVPLDLKNTEVGGKINTAESDCKSYRFLGNWQPEPETDMSVPAGAGAIVSTPVDLVKFSDALFGGKLLKPESLELMKTINDRFGMGLIQVPFFDKTGYGHTGGIDGFSSVFTHFDDGNISYAMTSNGSNYNNNNISIAVLSAAYNRPVEIPDFKTYSVNPADLDKYLGVYATTQLPLKITVTKSGSTLIAQGTGQSPFPLEATDKDKFKLEQAGIVMEFKPDEKIMILNQGGGRYTFTKE